MKITSMGTDFISIDENNLDDENLSRIPKIHLIKLNFFKPTKQKVEDVIENFPTTNRFVIIDNIRIYNYILKETNKKYYIENNPNSDIISFFRKNNKVLINFNNLNTFSKQFLLSDGVFEDVLKNTEVIMIDKSIFNEKRNVLKNWPGNVIISDGGITE
jgi:hypothetical protein